MFEKKHQKLVPVHVFMRRMVAHAAIVFLIILGALFLGIAGYHYLAGLGWIDALLNASMILGGMGPVDVLSTPTAKVFASAYALFSGVVFLATMSIIFVPILHRVLHAFHLDEKDSH